MSFRYCRRSETGIVASNDGRYPRVTLVFSLFCGSLVTASRVFFFGRPTGPRPCPFALCPLPHNAPTPFFSGSVFPLPFLPADLPRAASSFEVKAFFPPLEDFCSFFSVPVPFP